MKHPLLNDLQDYFDGEIKQSKESMIRAHLEECSRCSQVLSEMAKVDILFAKRNKISVSVETKEKVMSDVFAMLDNQKNQKEEKNLLAQKRIEKVKNTSLELKRLWDFASQEIQNPFVQAASLALIIGFVTEMARTTTEIKQVDIIDNDLTIFHSELLGDKNEMD